MINLKKDWWIDRLSSGYEAEMYAWCFSYSDAKKELEQARFKEANYNDKFRIRLTFKLSFNSRWYW